MHSGFFAFGAALGLGPVDGGRVEAALDGARSDADAIGLGLGLDAETDGATFGAPSDADDCDSLLAEGDGLAVPSTTLDIALEVGEAAA